MFHGWFGKASLAVLFLIPAWLAVGFVRRNYHVESEVFVIRYFLGIAVTSVFFGAPSFRSIIPSWGIVCGLLFFGMVVGGIANLSLFRAVSEAPNPGMAIAIGNTATVGVFLVSPLLGRFFPKYFKAVEMDPYALFGVLFVVIGVSLIALRR